MIRKAILTACGIIFAGSMTACIPEYEAVNPGPEPLTKREARKVLRCQEAIKYRGQAFVEAKLHALESCADLVLEQKLLYENGLIDYEEYKHGLEWAVHDECVPHLDHVRKESTRFVNTVTRRCTRVADIVLDPRARRGDPLGFQYFLPFMGEDETPVPTATATDPPEVVRSLDRQRRRRAAERLAGVQCGLKEVFVDMMVSFEVPRSNEMCEILYEVYKDEMDAFSGGASCPQALVHLLNTKFLDKRCMLGVKMANELGQSVLP